MKTLLLQITIATGLIFGFFSCAPVYVPNTLNTPLFSKAGELSSTTQIAFSGLDQQLAYSITDNLGVMLNGNFQNTQRDPERFSENFQKHIFGEAGAGYYTGIGVSNFIFEVYGGFGLGNFYAKYFPVSFSESNGIPRISNVDLNRFFLQPGIGLKNRIFELSLALRLSNVNFMRSHTNDVIIDTNKPYFFAEPALTARLGSKNIKCISQIGASIFLNKDESINYNPFIFSLGIQLNFDLLAKKMKETN